jgi:hypothetical protein
VSSVALTGLGTGTGKVSIKEVANLYKILLEPITDFDIILCDPFGKLIKEYEKL